MDAASSITTRSAWLNLELSLGNINWINCRWDLKTLILMTQFENSWLVDYNISKCIFSLKPKASSPMMTNSKNVFKFSGVGEDTKIFEKPH